jgi:hypothetical protein
MKGCSTNKLLGLSASLSLALLAFAAPALAQEEEQEEAVLEAIRVATERFKDVNVALEEGYIADPSGECATAEMEGLPAEAGAMGIHYFRPDLLGITSTEPRVDGTGIYTDFLNPAILLYEPQEDGSVELVAVENLVFKEAWEAAGNTEPPVFAGHTFNDMEDDPNTEVDEAHGFAPHYDLHVWVFRENPNGAFEPFNPAVSCEHAAEGGHGH